MRGGRKCQRVKPVQLNGAAPAVVRQMSHRPPVRPLARPHRASERPAVRIVQQVTRNLSQHASRTSMRREPYACLFRLWAIATRRHPHVPYR